MPRFVGETRGTRAARICVPLETRLTVVERVRELARSKLMCSQHCSLAEVRRCGDAELRSECIGAHIGEGGQRSLFTTLSTSRGAQLRRCEVEE